MNLLRLFCLLWLAAAAASLSTAAAAAADPADLALTKVVDSSTPNVGDTVNFTVTLTNNGPDPATSVTVSDLLPPGLPFVSATTSQGTYNPTTGVWTVGTVNVGSPLTLVLAATVAGPGTETNSAFVSHSDQPDPNLTNNSASVSLTPQEADLALAKSVDNPTPNVGDIIHFTVTLTDNGPDPATGITVLDLLPPGLTFISATPSTGTYDPTTGVWTVPAVSMGAPLTLVFTARVVSPSAQTNVATVTDSDQFDQNPGNDTATATETPQLAVLAMAKSVDNPTPNVGDTIHFTVTLTDRGPDTATGVTVVDVLPPGLKLVSATPSEGTYAPATGVWTVGTVTTTTPQTLAITATVVAPGTQTNTATVTHSDQFDTNPTSLSASATETAAQPVVAAVSAPSAAPTVSAVSAVPALPPTGAQPAPPPPPRPGLPALAAMLLAGGLLGGPAVLALVEVARRRWPVATLP